VLCSVLLVHPQVQEIGRSEYAACDNSHRNSRYLLWRHLHHEPIQRAMRNRPPDDSPSHLTVKGANHTLHC
jgi:hypothetical protein